MSHWDGLEHVVQADVPLAPFNSLRIGGAARYLAVPTSMDELVAVVKQAKENQLAVKVLGEGANVLIPSAGFDGMVVQLSAPEFTSLRVDGSNLIAGGGVKLAHFISTAAREGFKGPEQLVGIPGTVGGALHVNTSTVGGSIGAWVQSATVVTGNGDVVQRSRSEMNFSYRQSSLNELAVVAATFEFEREAPEQLVRRMQKLWIVRKSKQPLIDEPCAYVFKDHGGSTATQVLTQVGVAGMKVGGIEVSDRDPNFFVSRPGATSDDFLALANQIQKKVSEKLNIELQLSVEVW